MKRSKTDLCLLCKSNPSDKRNSHIIPKFINKSILKDGDGKVRMISSKEGVQKKQPQDSPKEDYILCSACEKKLGSLESTYADKAQTPTYTGSFAGFDEITQKKDEIPVYQFKERIGWGFTFWLSIFWRISISSHFIFLKQKLPLVTEEQVRNILNNALNTTGFFSIQNEMSFVIYATTKTKNDSSNIISPTFNGPHTFALTSNTYAIIFDANNDPDLQKIARRNIRTIYNNLVIIQRPQDSLKDFNRHAHEEMEKRLIRKKR